MEGGGWVITQPVATPPSVTHTPPSSSSQLSQANLVEAIAEIARQCGTRITVVPFDPHKATDEDRARYAPMTVSAASVDNASAIVMALAHAQKTSAQLCSFHGNNRTVYEQTTHLKAPQTMHGYTKGTNGEMRLNYCRRKPEEGPCNRIHLK